MSIICLIFKYRQANGDFYSIVGLLTLWIIIINLWFIFKFGRLWLLPLIYNQTIVILLLSSDNILAENKSFTNILSNLNLSFDFLTPKLLNKKFGWTNDSIKMQNMHFYCNSTFLNYKWAILIAAVGTVIYWLISIVANKLNKCQGFGSNSKWFRKIL